MKTVPLHTLMWMSYGVSIAAGQISSSRDKIVYEKRGCLRYVDTTSQYYRMISVTQ